MALKPLKDIPEWWELCARYRYDIYAFAVEALGVRRGSKNYYLSQSSLMVAVHRLHRAMVALVKVQKSV